MAGRALYQFAYRRSPDQDAPLPVRRPVVVVGAGPVGLVLAIDLAGRGVPVVVLDDSDRIGEGSRGLCYAKRTLEILDRLGAARPCLEKGVVWQVGKVFQGEELLYAFDLLPEAGYAMPAFINLQQFYLEYVLVSRLASFGLAELRWRNRVSAMEALADGVRLTVDTPDGPYALEADWVVAADGARSTMRALAGLPFVGEAFEDRFLIADVAMEADMPAERRFWFDPPFHAGRSALLHKQPDGVWRIDLQLGPDADPEAERQPDRVIPRIRRMVGHDRFRVEWVSVYTFQCRRIARFVRDRLIFAGDAAHQVSPFGARGANSGIQDAENLAWKLARVVQGRSPASLLASYDAERSAAADENIAHSTRSTDFIAPRTPQEKRFRDAALALARCTDLGRRMVNSGRLSTPSSYRTALSTPDADGETWTGGCTPGSPLPDAPISWRDGRTGWLLEAVGGDEVLIEMGETGIALPEGVRRLRIGIDVHDDQGLVAARLGAPAGAALLVRPDQHVAARWKRPEAAAVAAASRRLNGWTEAGA